MRIFNAQEASNSLTLIMMTGEYANVRRYTALRE